MHGGLQAHLSVSSPKPPSPPVTHPITVAQAAHRAGIVVDGDDSAAELVRDVLGQGVPLQPIAVRQPDASSPPIVRNPPHAPGPVFPEHPCHLARRDAHLNRRAPTHLRGYPLWDVYVAQ